MLKGQKGQKFRKPTAPLIFFASNKIRNCNIKLSVVIGLRHTSVARCRKTARHFARIISNYVLMVCVHVAVGPLFPFRKLDTLPRKMDVEDWTRTSVPRKYEETCNYFQVG